MQFIYFKEKGIKIYTNSVFQIILIVFNLKVKAHPFPSFVRV